MVNESKIIVILGQTSTGKSDFAVEVAKQINGEIISADSRQVYKGMDLGTGKITKKEMGGVPHHLLDVVSPKKVFSVDDFQKLANKKIEEIIEKGNVPIICGGTGFYIDTLINKTSLPKIPPNEKLRKKLSNKTTQELFKMLKKLDEKKSKVIDKKNKVRLIRAIEIARVLGKVPQFPTKSFLVEQNKSATNFEVLKIGLELPPETLKERIYNRIIVRIKKGMLQEIKNLHDKGISWKRMDQLGLEYRYGALFWQKKLKKDETIEKLNTKTWHYAKRQKTWFKRDKNTIWINPLKNSEKSKALRDLKKFLK